MTKAERKRIDKKVSDAYSAVGNGIVIDIFEIPKIYALGAKAIADGADDEALRTIIAGYLDGIRKN